ncbi:MAG: LysE family translocator [Pseudomonadota bacterium]
MSWAEWLFLAAICALGAMSPGPSLALLVRCTTQGGRPAGMTMALAHAVGIGLYALAVAVGLAVVLTGSPKFFEAVRLGGAIFLLWLGIQGLRSRGAVDMDDGGARTMSLGAAARSGFLIAFLNPKIAVWFLALFSQFVAADSGLGVRLAMAALAAVIDGVWYVIVALTLSTGPLLRWLRRNARLIDRVFGVVLILIAIRVATLQGL